MSWMESSSSNHSCGCHKKDDHKNHDCGCHKKDNHKHHKCDCHEKRAKYDKCSWYKHRNDNEWRRRCRNRLERVQVVSGATNSGSDNSSVNGSSNGIGDCSHKKRKKRKDDMVV